MVKSNVVPVVLCGLLLPYLPAWAQSGGAQYWGSYPPAWDYPAETREVLVQNTDGETFWLGTSGGLVEVEPATGKTTRYDLRDLPRSAYDVTAIERDEGRNVWALAEGSLWRFDGSRWTETGRYGTSLLKLADGTLALCGRDSLQWFLNGTWKAAHFPSMTGFLRIVSSQLASAGEGRIWVYSEWASDDVIFGGRLDEFDTRSGRLLKTLGVPANPKPSGWGNTLNIRCMAVDSAGILWAANWNGLARVVDSGLALVQLPILQGEDITHLLPDGDGSMWIGTRTGLFHWSGRESSGSVSRTMISMGPVMDLSRDRKGMLWVGTYSGLLSQKDGAWRALGVHSIDLPSNTIWAMAPMGSDLWVGTEAGLARCDAAEHWHAPVVEGIAAGSRLSVTALAVESSRTVGPSVWGVGQDLGLFRFTPVPSQSDGDRSGRWTWFTPENSPLPGKIHDLTQGGMGEIWAAGDSGLYHFEKETWTRVLDPIGGFPPFKKSLASDGQGNLWMGSASSLLRFDGTAWHVERDSGLMDLVFDAGGRLWGQGRTGFYWLEAGRWNKRSYPSGGDYGLNTIHALAADAAGHVLFFHELCGPGSCPDFSPHPREFGFVTPDTLVLTEVDIPGVTPTCLAIKDGWWPWIGSQRGLVREYQDYDLGVFQGRGRDLRGTLQSWGLGFPGSTGRIMPSSRVRDIRGRSGPGSSTGVQVLSPGTGK